MDRRILFINENKSFLAGAMIQSLTDAHFDVVSVQPDVVEIQHVYHLPDIFIVYLEGDIEIFSGALRHLQKLVEDKSSRLLYLIGNHTEVLEAQCIVPNSLVAATFERPVIIKDLLMHLSAALDLSNMTGGRKRILIVDDNDANLLVASKLLRETKVQVDTAQSGLECLKKTEASRYDLILMDHLMPEMDGIECLHAIRSQVGGLCTRTPVVALTANAGSDSQSLYAKEGFDAYLVKPVNGALLEACVLKLLPEELVTFSTVAAEAPEKYRLEQKHKERTPLLVTTDSISDLPRELVEKLHIPVLPYVVHTERGDFLDGIETDSDGVLSYIKDGQHQAKDDAQHFLHVTVPPYVQSRKQVPFR